MLRLCPTIALCDYFTCFLMVERRFVRPFAPQRIVLVAHHNDPASYWDIFPFDGTRVSAAVPFFMMSNCNCFGHFKYCALRIREYFAADGTVGFHCIELARKQRAI